MATRDAINNTLAGQTGTGSYAGSTSPSFTTPAIGAATGTSLNLGSSTTMTGMIDDDSMATASASTAASSESIKAYVDAQVALAEGRLLAVQVFSTPGTATYTPTSGTTFAIIEAQGSGGGGGAASNDVTVGGGGSAGGWLRAYWSSPNSQTVTVGAAGAASSGAAGGNGNDSSVGTLAIGRGGVGGLANGAGTPVLGGGVTTSGTTNIGSQTGEAGPMGGLIATGGESGSSGYGGNSYFGAGGTRGTAGGAGSDGRGFGSGGGGGNRNTVTTRQGGAGGQGLVIIWDYT